MSKPFQLNNRYDYIKYALWIIFVLQIIILGIFNLTQGQYHIGFDASSYYLKAMEMAKQKTPFIDKWVEQTTLYLDSAVPVAAFFYVITGKIFFSYGLANFLIDIAIFVVFYLITKSLNLSGMSKVVCLNLIACFYLMPGSYNNINDMSYFSSLLGAAGWYGFKILIILMVIKMVLDLKDNGRKINYLYIVLTECLLFVSGVSSGWYLLVTIIVPLLGFYIIKAFVKNDVGEVFNSQTLVLLIGAIVSFSGKIVAVKLLNFTSKDGEMICVSLNVFWKNLGSVLLGFLELLGAVPCDSKTPILSLNGIVCLLAFFIFIVCFTGIIYVFKKVTTNFDNFEKYGMLLCIVGINLLMFIVLYTTYGSERFEIRYLLPLFLLIVMTVGAFIDSLSDTLLFKMAGMIVLSTCILILNIYNDNLYYSTKNNYDILLQISQKAEEYDAEVVYFYEPDFAVDVRNLRAVDGNRIYKCVEGDNIGIFHWGDYTYFDDLADAPERHVLVTSDEYFKKMPEYFQNLYTLIVRIDKYSLYVADENKFDFKSGISGNYGLDLPTSRGIVCTNGFIDSAGCFVSDGTQVQCLKGPGVKLQPGIYDFKINYEVIEYNEKAGDFLITFNSNNEIAAQVEMLPSQTSAIINNVNFIYPCNNLNYCVFNYNGAIIKIKSFEIFKRDE